ncbi:MAG TPA: DEAD/DEAH box helicase family protein [Thermodesulfovibrio thiophilus]|nr:DEAD/DEAH box helicase family protein [Thermodesulfovibrio thiophilus]HQD36908.1 DEAD/DEAH box helicase family protein [Thermodesulfovibrio thiophilus]
MKIDGVKITEVKAMAKATVDEGVANTLMQNLTVTYSENAFKEHFIFKLYKRLDKKTFLLPRAYVSDYKVPVTESSSWYLDTHVISKVKLRPEQEVVKKSFFEAINSNSIYGGIIEAKTGFGKTFLLLDIIATIGHRTLVVVPTTFLMKQWLERIPQLTNIKPEEIGIIQQNRCDVEGKKIAVGMLHSLSMKKYPDYIYDYFHNVVYDEIHRMSTRVFHVVVAMFHSKYNIGASATPRRKDGTDNVFKYNIGDVIARSTTVTCKPEVIIYKYFNNATSDSGCLTRDGVNIGRYYNKLAKCVDRTVKIANVVKKLHDKGRKVLVLSDRLLILQSIAKYLKSQNISNYGFLTGNEKNADNKSIILGTYGSAGLGADIKGVNALVFATPRTDIEQAFGRVTRSQDANVVVVDFVDICASSMNLWLKKRKKFYRNFASKIIEYNGGV